MTRVTASISVSLDGYITGPDPGPGQGLGVGGDVLHHWFSDAAAPDRAEITKDAVLAEQFDAMGAMITGRDGYEHAEEAWGNEPPFAVPVFVLTHWERPDDVRVGTTFHFVVEGFAAALRRAREAAGEKNVSLHGASPIQQALRAGVLDELQIHMVPVLLGAGRRLLEDTGDTQVRLEPIRVVPAPAVTHLKYRVCR